MSQYMLKYVITGTSATPFEDIMEKFDPLLLSEVNLVLSSMLGGECCIEVEHIELLAAEGIEM
jgi:hypothetical protein